MVVESVAAIYFTNFLPSTSPQRLRVLYSKILASVQTMPQDAAYRKYTEQLVNQRLDFVKTVSNGVRGRVG